ncbi:ABC transporter ATP-binding protein [Sphaerochaeta halotolerans]|uniref:ABC transporter ATP-binding protein n=1 Tax=Sphaerochaeta halotolerans TaxID=2293840 RepID=A0A372MIM4_9SPIR|nr:ABC transporter ATP-binding protein [Sphaerochaeta halotolerans]RFU95647.1 ABC transporter ATP-binding protein [Sphaerochaeta halotolerans]
MLLQVDEVIKRFGSTLALDCCSMQVEEGEVIGLLGPNGAGKTTCIRSIIGLIPIDEGSITVFSQKQDGKNREIRRNIGYVTQEITIYEQMSGRDNLAFFASLYGMDKLSIANRIEEVAQIIGLEGRLDDKPKHYSGGMKRRLNIGCALIHSPRLIIMDEPTVGIDPQSRSFILRFVKQLARDGSTIIYTSHYIEEVEAVASRIYIMDNGHMIAQGTLPELIARIQGDHFIEVEVRIASEEKKLQLQQLPDVKEVALEGNRYRIVVPGGIPVLDKIVLILSEQGLVTINTKQPNLEDVFLTLTGKQLRDEVQS